MSANSSIIAASTARAVEARGAQARGVTGKLDTTSALGRAVQVALAANTTKATVIQKSLGALGAAKADLLSVQQLVTELVSLNNRQAAIAVDQEKALSAVGGAAADQNLTDEFNAIEAKKTSLVANFKGNIDGLTTTAGTGSKDISITLADGSVLAFSVQGLTSAGLREAAGDYAAPFADQVAGLALLTAAGGDADAAHADAKNAAVTAASVPNATRASVVYAAMNLGANDATQAQADAMAAVLLPVTAVTVIDGADVDAAKAAVAAAKVTMQKLAAELGSRLESIGAALGKVENIISDQEQLAGAILANSEDIGANDQLTDTQLQNTAKTAQKSAAFAIAQAMQQIADVMSILNR